MDRRKFLTTAGATAVGLSIAGCLGGDNAQSQPQPGDEPITPAGWFSINGSVKKPKGADNLKITQTSLFRTSNGFGILGQVKNIGNQPYLNVTIHAQLQTGGGEIIGNGTAGFNETDSIADLGAGEVWNWRLFFEDTDPQAFVGGGGGGNQSGAKQKVSSYQVWATGNLKGDPSGGGGGGGNQSGGGGGT